TRATVFGSRQAGAASARWSSTAYASARYSFSSLTRAEVSLEALDDERPHSRGHHIHAGEHDRRRRQARGEDTADRRLDRTHTSPRTRTCRDATRTARMRT